MATPAVLPPNYFFQPHQNVLLQKWKSRMIIRNKKQTKHSSYLFSLYINFTLLNISEILCFADRVSRYIRVMKTNLMRYLSCLFRQLTSTCFGHICSPSSGAILYKYNNWYVLCFWPDQQTANWKAQLVTTVVHIQYTSWWWATDMPETCRGWLTK